MFLLPRYSRRHLLQQWAMGAVTLAAPGAFAELLRETPPQTAGPYYPDHLPLDTDNDLILINDTTSSAVGEITHLRGRILDRSGAPIRNATVELWQVDNNAAYIHSADRSPGKNDSNFQGFGRFLTSSTGEYYFRTIKPVPYPGRTPHIHIAVLRQGMERFTTQCYVKGEALNDNDGVFKAATREEGSRAFIEVPFNLIPDSPIGELEASFDIVLGTTPQG